MNHKTFRLFHIILFSNSSFKKAVFLSSWCTMKLWIAIKEISTLMDLTLVDRWISVKKIYIFSLFKTFDYKVILDLSTVSSGFNFFFKINLQPISLQTEGKSTKCLILLDGRKSISLFIVSCHKSTKKTKLL